MFDFTLLLGVFTLLGFSYIAKRNYKYSILLLSILLPLDNRIYFNWGFNRASPIRWAIAGIVIYLLYEFILMNRGKSFKVFLNKFILYIKTDVFFSILLLVWLVRLISFTVSLNIQSSISYQTFFTEVVLLYILCKKAYVAYGVSFIKDFVKFYV